jgi:hypothetical protein
VGGNVRNPGARYYCCMGFRPRNTKYGCKDFCWAVEDTPDELQLWASLPPAQEPIPMDEAYPRSSSQAQSATSTSTTTGRATSKKGTSKAMHGFGDCSHGIYETLVN